MCNSVYYVHMEQPFSKTDLALERRLSSKDLLSRNNIYKMNNIYFMILICVLYDN